MLDLVYYYVPTEYMSFEKKLRQVCNVNIENWSEIDVADSLKEAKSMTFWERTSKIHFFIDESDKVAQFFWELKDQMEEISLKKKKSQLKKEFITEKINDQGGVELKLNEVIFNNYYHAFLYTKGHDLKKIIYINEAEIINIFFKKEQTHEVENIMEKWAKKTEYCTFQLDLDDEEGTKC